MPKNGCKLDFFHGKYRTPFRLASGVQNKLDKIAMFSKGNIFIYYFILLHQTSTTGSQGFLFIICRFPTLTDQFSRKSLKFWQWITKRLQGRGDKKMDVFNFWIIFCQNKDIATLLHYTHETNYLHVFLSWLNQWSSKFAFLRAKLFLSIFGRKSRRNHRAL